MLSLGFDFISAGAHLNIYNIMHSDLFRSMKLGVIMVTQ